MLSHSISTHGTWRSLPARDMQDAAVWSAIEAVIRSKGALTTRGVAERIGLSPSATQARLYELRELGEVRLVAVGTGRARTWALGAEEFAVRAEEMAPLLTKAQQLGTFVRDPLVAALFGAPRQVQA